MILGEKQIKGICEFFLRKIVQTIEINVPPSDDCSLFQIGNKRDLISLRTKEALAAKKAKGIHLGKPKEQFKKSIYNKDLETIKSWLALGLSGRNISANLGYGSYISLNTFLKRRRL